jgi:predicted short-subunit dehydrogenase-like oxidoreductase (DUF2520 family)
MKVVIIGSGNVGTVLGRKIQVSGHTILQVMSRHLQHAKLLAGILDCEATNDWQKINLNGDLYLLALTDKTLLHLAEHLQLNHALAVHTAGSVSKDVLGGITTNYGVVYPLQSLRIGMEPIPDLPLLVDGNSPDALALISDFAHSLSNQVTTVGDTERSKLHLSAVITGNFTNHLFSLAQDYCDKEGLDFSLLLPLIRETIDRMKFYSPGAVQTGPAIRNDRETLRKHVAMLEQYPALKKLYKTFSRSIRDFHRESKK